jgi:hypothetical protein
MKIIKIFQENTETIELIDNDKTDRSEYILQLKNLLESNDIMILETSTASIIVRPHKINSILVADDKLNIKENNDDNIKDSEDFVRG